MVFIQKAIVADTKLKRIKKAGHSTKLSSKFDTLHGLFDVNANQKCPLLTQAEVSPPRGKG